MASDRLQQLIIEQEAIEHAIKRAYSSRQATDLMRRLFEVKREIKRLEA